MLVLPFLWWECFLEKTGKKFSISPLINAFLLSLTGSVLISALVLHFFGVVGWANTSHYNQIIPNPISRGQSSGPQGLRFLTCSLMVTLTGILKLPSFVLDFFSLVFNFHLCSTTAILSPFYHITNFVFNYFKLFLLLSWNSVLLSITMTKEKDMLANLFWGSEWLWIVFNSAKSWAICKKKKSKPLVCLLS